MATIEGQVLTPEQEQEKWLGESLSAVQEKSAYLRGAIQQGSVLQTLQCASQMLSELRTGMLTPQNYYELYMKVFDEMQHVLMFFHEQVAIGATDVEQLYATAQHAGNIVPRLMLLITVAAVYIKTKQAPAKDILADLIEMVKGVQHPTRGLFIRYYLSSLMKNYLPDEDSEYEGTVEDSARFVVQNLKEMVWLWFRMEAKSTIRNKAQRDRERRELRVLVGTNLVRLSQLDGIDKGMYKETILPAILRIILDHREPIAQQYLFEVVVQAFPDEFHLATLPLLLDGLTEVVSGVDVQSILSPLLDRLGNYVVSIRDGTAEASGSRREEKVIRNMFTIFQEKISDLVSKHNTATFPPSAFAETLFGLVKMSLRVYPDAYDRVDAVLGAVYNYFSQAEGQMADASAKTVRKMLDHILSEIGDANVVLAFEHYANVISLLQFAPRRAVALGFVNGASKSGNKVGTAETVGVMFDIIAPLVKDVEDRPANKADVYQFDVVAEFVEEQHAVCRALHLIDTDDDLLLSKLYSGVRKQLGQGGPERMRYTLKAMASLYMKLAIRCKKNEAAGNEPTVNIAKLFGYLYTGDGKGMLEHLAAVAPAETFFMYLNAANIADTCEQPDTCYDLFAAAFLIYEESAANSKIQLKMLSSMIGSLAALRTMDETTYDNIATKLCQYSCGVVQKWDQSRMVMMCSHLFWKKVLSAEYHRKVMECLQRSLKIADRCPTGQQFGIFADALNHYMYYYAAQTPQVTDKAVQALIDMNSEAMNGAEDKSSESYAAAKKFFRNSVRYITNRQQEGDERWTELTV